jgi:hypothetical protein
MGAMEREQVLPSVTAHAVDFGTVVWEPTGYPTVQRPLGLTILGPAGCTTMADGWTVQLGTDGMTAPEGSTIPPAAMAYLGPSGNIPQGLVASTGPQSLSPTGVTIASGSASVADGSSWVISLEVSPPDETPPGTYSGTITVDILSASP